MEWFTLETSRQTMDGGAMFGNAPKALWSRWIQSDENNGIELAGRCLVVRTENITAVIDAGTSPFMEPKYAERYGIEETENKLITNLAEKNVAEEDVTHILVSHLHFDHVGGIVPAWPAIREPGWSPHFPNAKYVVTRKQYERSISPHPRDCASFIPGLCEKMNETGRLVLLDDDTTTLPELAEFVSFIFSEGHTPGLLQPLVRINDETLFFASDMIPGTPWVHLPISTAFDRNPELLINEKKIVLDRAVAENWTVVYAHDPVTAASRITLNNETGKYKAIIPDAI